MYTFAPDIKEDERKKRERERERERERLNSACFYCKL